MSEKKIKYFFIFLFLITAVLVWGVFFRAGPEKSPPEIIRWCPPAPVGRISPIDFTHDLGGNLCDLVFEKLVRVDSEGNHRKSLAEKIITVSPDTVRVRLVPDFLFHDNTPVTARDVAFSIQAHKTQGFRTKNYAVRRIQSCDVLDPHTVRIRFREPVRAPERFLCFEILPRQLLTPLTPDTVRAFNRAPVGAGPYRVAGTETDGSVRLAAFSKYGRGAPANQGIRIRPVGTRDAAFAAFMRGESDFCPYIRRENREAAASCRGIETIRFRYSFHCLVLNFTNPLLRKLKVRKALRACLDVREIIRIVEGSPEHGLLSAGGFDFQPCSDRDPAYDPVQAVQLLESAGLVLKSGQSFRTFGGEFFQLDLCTFFTSINALKCLRIVREQLAAVGIRTRIVCPPFERAPDICEFTPFPFFDSPERIHTLINSSKRVIHPKFLLAPEAVSIMLRKYIDGRQPLHPEYLCQIFEEQKIMIPLYTPFLYCAYHCSLSNIKKVLNFRLNLFRLMDVSVQTMP